MQIQLTIKGQQVSLELSEVNDVLRALEHGARGRTEAKTFGCCVVHGAAQGGKLPGALTFSEQPPKVDYTLTDF